MTAPSQSGCMTDVPSIKSRSIVNALIGSCMKGKGNGTMNAVLSHAKATFHSRSEEEARHDHVVAERGFVCGAHVAGTQGSNIAAATGRYGSARTSALRDARALESINRSGAISSANGSVSVGPPANTIDYGLHATKRRGPG
jgi:hypothetical protein